MAGRLLRMCSSMLPAMGHGSRARECGVGWRGAAHRRRASAPLVFDCRFVAALSRSLLLADRADDSLGVHPDLHDAAIELLRAGWGNTARRGDVMGRAVSRTDRPRDLVFRGSLFAQ